MKKMILYMVMLIIVLGAFGCSRKDMIITTEEISDNTLLAKSNGQLQVATVEDFGEGYYQLSELEEFITKEINKYNQAAGADNIIIDDIQVRNNKAIMLLSYTGMDQYAAFNKVTSAYFNGGITELPFDMPATLASAKDGSATNTLEVLKNEKYKVLVMNEPYDIIVDGKIKYYSDNAVLKDKNTLQSAQEGMTVVVFKP